MQQEFEMFAIETAKSLAEKIDETHNKVINLIIKLTFGFMFFISVMFGVFFYAIFTINNKEPKVIVVEKETTKYIREPSKDLNINLSDINIFKTKRIKNKTLYYGKYQNKDYYFYITYYKK